MNKTRDCIWKILCCSSDHSVLVPKLNSIVCIPLFDLIPHALYNIIWEFSYMGYYSYNSTILISFQQCNRCLILTWLAKNHVPLIEILCFFFINLFFFLNIVLTVCTEHIYSCEILPPLNVSSLWLPIGMVYVQIQIFHLRKELECCSQ